MLKKLICIMCFALIFSTTAICSIAETNERVSIKNHQIMPRLTGIKNMTENLSIFGENAKVIIKVTAITGKSDKSTFSINLKKYENGKWVNVKSWLSNKEISAGKAIFNESYKVKKGYKYKFSGTIKIYNGETLVDTIDVESSEQKA